jgi:hypothetical protein
MPEEHANQGLARIGSVNAGGTPSKAVALSWAGSKSKYDSQTYFLCTNFARDRRLSHRVFRKYKISRSVDACYLVTNAAPQNTWSHRRDAKPRKNNHTGDRSLLQLTRLELMPSLLAGAIAIDIRDLRSRIG